MMIRTVIAKASLAFGIAVAIALTGQGVTHSAPVSAPVNCTDAPEFMPVNGCYGPLTDRPDLQGLNQCDNLPVQVDAGGVIVGDANRNGWLDGTDCADRRYVTAEGTVCPDDVIAEAWRDLSRGNYNGYLSTCAGVDEDSPLVDGAFRAIGR